MSLYDTLGIGKDADAAAIKRAFREKRGEAHPDRPGGDHKAMVALNQAYETLSDPEKRARYDKTGEDGDHPKPPLDTQARNLIMGLFDHIVEKADDSQPLIDLVRVNIKNNVDMARAKVSELRELIKRIEKRRKRLRYTGSERNFLLDLLELKVKAASQKAEALEEQMTVCDRALEILREFAYESEEAAVPAPSSFCFETLFGTYGDATWSSKS